MEFSTTIQNNIIPFVKAPLPPHKTEAARGPILYTAQTEAVKIASLHIPGDGYTIWRTEYTFHRQVSVAIRSPDPVLMLHFIFGDAIRLSVNGAPFLLRDRQFNLSYFPSFDAVAQAGKRPELGTVHIHFKPSFLERLINRSGYNSASRQNVGHQCHQIKKGVQPVIRYAGHRLSRIPEAG